MPNSEKSSSRAQQYPEGKRNIRLREDIPQEKPIYPINSSYSRYPEKLAAANAIGAVPGQLEITRLEMRRISDVHYKLLRKQPLFPHGRQQLDANSRRSQTERPPTSQRRNKIPNERDRNKGGEANTEKEVEETRRASSCLRLLFEHSVSARYVLGARVETYKKQFYPHLIHFIFKEQFLTSFTLYRAFRTKRQIIRSEKLAN